jgi:hypothetical protein
MPTEDEDDTHTECTLVDEDAILMDIAVEIEQKEPFQAPPLQAKHMNLTLSESDAIQYMEAFKTLPINIQGLLHQCLVNVEISPKHCGSAVIASWPASESITAGKKKVKAENLQESPCFALFKTIKKILKKSMGKARHEVRVFCALAVIQIVSTVEAALSGSIKSKDVIKYTSFALQRLVLALANTLLQKDDVMFFLNLREEDFCVGEDGEVLGDNAWQAKASQCLIKWLQDQYRDIVWFQEEVKPYDHSVISPSPEKTKPVVASETIIATTAIDLSSLTAGGGKKVNSLIAPRKERFRVFKNIGKEVSYIPPEQLAMQERQNLARQQREITRQQTLPNLLKPSEASQPQGPQSDVATGLPPRDRPVKRTTSFPPAHTGKNNKHLITSPFASPHKRRKLSSSIGSPFLHEHNTAHDGTPVTRASSSSMLPLNPSPIKSNLFHMSE